MTDTDTPTEAARAKRNFLSFSQQTALFEVLRRHCNTDAEGFAVYAPGLNDGAIAAMATERLGFAVTEGNVHGLRMEMLGKIRPPANGTRGAQNVAALALEVAALRENVEALGREVEKLTAYVFAAPDEDEEPPI